MGRRFLLGLALAVTLVAPGRASAAVNLSPCPEATNGLQCGTVDVPLDRSGGVPGTIPLHVEVLPASGLPRGTMFLIAGGPGQGSAGAYGLSSAKEMQDMFPGYTLVAFDNRGTGKSGVIRCPGLQTSQTSTIEQDAALARACAEIIGPQRVFYATRDHAEDMESVRVALGLGRVGLFGVSYGTKLAVAYALAHPSAVERIVLDSVVVPTFPDPFERNVLREMPGTLTEFCAGGICRGATSDFSGDVVKLANRLEARPVKGKVIAPDGRLRTLQMNGEDLVSMIIDADLSPGLAAEAPAAVHAALLGNARPLLRLYDLDLRTSELAPEDLSFGLYAATNCADGRFPFAPNTPPAARRPILDATIAALPPGSLGPFGNWGARMGTAYFCEQWPTPAGNTPLGPGPLPNVPVLALNGDFDLRTPTANAITVISAFPQGQLVTVPGVGHSVTSADFSGCAAEAVRRWILGTLGTFRAASCPRVPPVAKILGAFPPRPAKRTVKATLAAAAKTVREAQATWLQIVLSPASFAPRGLYGGKLVLAKGGLSFTLSRYSAVPGVAVSGKVEFVAVGPPLLYKGTVRVAGGAAVAGTLTFSKDSISGKLGGRAVKSSY
ncbi:MAG: alpha/beta hydrolase [Actinomycetota bacterium]|nr:alpha/beta hydrolase [Actinomycetota bacterium]